MPLCIQRTQADSENLVLPPALVEKSECLGAPPFSRALYQATHIDLTHYQEDLYAKNPLNGNFLLTSLDPKRGKSILLL
jgi:hypothetical protein